MRMSPLLLLSLGISLGWVEAGKWRKKLKPQPLATTPGNVVEKDAPRELVIPTKEDIRGHDCELECIRDLLSAVQPGSIDMSAGINIGSQLFARTHEQIATFCEAYVKSRLCVQHCDSRPRKSAVSRMFTAFDYMCVEHYDELVELLGCFNRSQERVARTCDPLCGSDEVLRQQESLTHALESSNFGLLGTVMSSICQVINCSLSCQKPIMLQTCGDLGAYYYLQGFVRAAFKPIKEIVSDQLGVSWATGCEALTAPDVAIVDVPAVESVSNRQGRMLTANGATGLTGLSTGLTAGLSLVLMTLAWIMG